MFSPGEVWNPVNVEIQEKAQWKWKSYLDKGIIESKSGKVFAEYIPYSVDRQNWGIYLHKNEIVKDAVILAKLMKDKNIARAIVAAYVSLVFFHELAHHVIEDLRAPHFKYNEEDESLCEYTAFTLTEAMLKRSPLELGNFGEPNTRQKTAVLVGGISENHFLIGYPLPGYAFKGFMDIIGEVANRVRIVPFFNVKSLDAKKVLSIIYYWRDEAYKPVVPSWVNESEYVSSLSRNLAVGFDDLWSNVESVYSRVSIVS
ncbi:hypothetical protein [Acidianus sp. HS-5]|uniref:hypothetical protein n=1 Tax=Acidianus sp. HS-5 TaxID=2886040 RepID=UPI001F333052|nr:hypothetical protein [Acidianus sp. HS-5]BDC17500.1 hypothetical protein HS5_03900 [Acidianus sp. HS-5]